MIRCHRCNKNLSNGQATRNCGSLIFCEGCFDFWSAGRDVQSLGRIDALEASNDANLAMLKEAQRLHDLRETQLADCTRAMREVSIEMDGLRKAIDNRVVEANSAAQIIQACVQKLDAAHAGKVGA